MFASGRPPVNKRSLCDASVVPPPRVVSVGFMAPCILAVTLCGVGLTEQLGRGGRFTVGPGGPLVPSGGR